LCQSLPAAAVRCVRAVQPCPSDLPCHASHVCTSPVLGSTSTHTGTRLFPRFVSLSWWSPRVFSSDVTKLVKICIRPMQILTFKTRRMRIEAFILSVGMQCTRLGELNDCNNILFHKVNKTGVQISTV